MSLDSNYDTFLDVEPRAIKKENVGEEDEDGDGDDYDLPRSENDYEEVPPIVPLRKYTLLQPNTNNGGKGDDTMTKWMAARSAVQEKTYAKPSSSPLFFCDRKDARARSSDYDPLWPDDEVFDGVGDVIYAIPEEISKSKQEESSIERSVVLQRPPLQPQMVKKERFSIQIVEGEMPSSRSNNLQSVRASRRLRTHEESIMCRRQRPSATSSFCSTLSRQNHLQKSGKILCKIPNTRTWKELFCVVSADVLALYEEGSATHVPLCSLPLSSRVLLRRLGKEKKRNVFSISSPGLTLLLGTLDVVEMEAWMAVIEGFVRITKTTETIQKGKIEGRCIKVKHGFRRERWISLVGRVLFYSKEEGSHPLGRISLNHATLDIFDPDEISDPEDNADMNAEYSLQIMTPRAVYQLLFTSKLTRDRWAFYCANVMGIHFKKVGTVLERGMLLHMQKLHDLRMNEVHTPMPAHSSLLTPTVSSIEDALANGTQVQADKGVDALSSMNDNNVSLHRFLASQPSIDSQSPGMSSSSQKSPLSTPLPATSSSKEVDDMDSDMDDDDDFPFWITEEDLTLLTPLTEPLTTLPSKELEEKALSLWQSIQLFCGTQEESKGIAYHYKLVQQIFKTTFVETPVLWDEFICQLIKATNVDEHRMTAAFDDTDDENDGDADDVKTSGDKSRDVEESKNTPLVMLSNRRELTRWGFQRKQSWQLLSLACPLRKPGKLILRFLRSYLDDVIANNEGEEREYAKYCRRCVHRVITMGDRLHVPSLTELEAVIVRHPNDFSHPMSVVIYVSNDNHYVAGFDASTTFAELASSVCASLGVRDPKESGFAIYLNDPLHPEEDVEHCMVGTFKIGDAFSRWEEQHEAGTHGRIIPQSPVLTLKKRYWYSGGEPTPVEKVLVCYDLGERMHGDAFPLSARSCIKIAARLAQIEFGNLDEVEDKALAAKTIKNLYLPCRDYSGYIQRESSVSEDEFYGDDSGGCVFEKDKSTRDLLEDWASSKGRDIIQLADEMISIASTWKHMASTVVYAQMQPGHLSSFSQDVYLSICADNVTLLSEWFEEMEVIPFHNIKSFGISDEFFRLSYESEHAQNQSPGLQFPVTKTLTARVKQKLSVSIPRTLFSPIKLQHQHQQSQPQQQLQQDDEVQATSAKLLRMQPVTESTVANLLLHVDQVGELTVLIATYINHLVAEKGITDAVAQISQIVS
eukprot:m.117417 g.117417  ORF g.117417 m.117417 type:complete len:1202 (-) comp9322_c0_seq1:122-3727(-)